MLRCSAACCASIAIAPNCKSDCNSRFERGSPGSPHHDRERPVQHNPRFTFQAANPGYIPAKLPLTDPLGLQGKDIPDRKSVV